MKICHTCSKWSKSPDQIFYSKKCIPPIKTSSISKKQVMYRESSPQFMLDHLEEEKECRSKYHFIYASGGGGAFLFQRSFGKWDRWATKMRVIRSSNSALFRTNSSRSSRACEGIINTKHITDDTGIQWILLTITKRKRRIYKGNMQLVNTNHFTEVNESNDSTVLTTERISERHS